MPLVQTTADRLYGATQPRDGTYGLSAPGTPPAQPGIEIEAPAPVLADLSIEIDEDGGVTIGAPAPPKPRSTGFDENLAEVLQIGDLAVVAEDILQGIEADIASRREFLANLTTGMDLLGLKVEKANSQSTKGGGYSRVRNPLLLEAVITFQSGFVGEMLPASGPAKVKTIGGSTAETDQLASDFEADLNHYLTDIAREFYPDTDRMAFSLGYSGNGFKKVYTCPRRKRPVSESVQVKDMIVSEDATDLDNATRVTHRILMSPGMVRRMQRVGAYIDVPLGVATPMPTPVDQKEDEIAGISASGARPQDVQRTIYECYTDIDLSEFGHAEKGAPEGIELPYKVTIDATSRQVLEIRRNWKQGDPSFQKRQRFVHYQLVPGFGFLAFGFLHLLGNSAQTLTAIWRILCDAGMFSNFPGGVKVKGARAANNEIQPMPGEWTEIDVAGMDDIRKTLMPLPYKDPSPVFIQLAEMIQQDAMRLGGTVEMEVGDGRANVPVGTIMAMIEQQTKIMAAVHKRLHRAQQLELQLLRDEFMDDPGALARLARNPRRTWEVAEEFASLDLVPASDPNVPAQMHRIMLATALVSLASSNPDIYDKYAAHKHALEVVGIRDADRYVHPSVPMPGGPAKAAGKSSQELALEAQKLAADIEDSKRKAAADLAENTQQLQSHRLDLANDAAARESAQRLAEMQAASDAEARALDQRKIDVQAAKIAADMERTKMQAAAQKRQAKTAARKPKE